MPTEGAYMLDMAILLSFFNLRLIQKRTAFHLGMHCAADESCCLYYVAHPDIACLCCVLINHRLKLLCGILEATFLHRLRAKLFQIYQSELNAV